MKARTDRRKSQKRRTLFHFQLRAEQPQEEAYAIHIESGNALLIVHSENSLPTALTTLRQTNSRIFTGLSKIADKAASPDDVDKLCRTLANASSIGAKGRRYEPEAMAHLIDAKGISKVEAIQKFSHTVAGKTDIDFIGDGVYYQMKRSKNAFRSPKADKVQKWIEKAVEDGASKIRYVVPNKASDVPKSARKMINSYSKKMDIKIIEAPHK